MTKRQLATVFWKPYLPSSSPSQPSTARIVNLRRTSAFGFNSANPSFLQALLRPCLLTPIYPPRTTRHETDFQLASCYREAIHICNHGYHGQHRGGVPHEELQYVQPGRRIASEQPMLTGSTRYLRTMVSSTSAPGECPQSAQSGIRGCLVSGFLNRLHCG